MTLSQGDGVSVQEDAVRDLEAAVAELRAEIERCPDAE